MGGNEGSVRAFVAVPVPGEIKDAVREVGHAWKRELEGIRWVDPDNLHLTLKFLGQTPIEKVKRIVSALGNHLAGEGSFTVEFEGLEAFPSTRRPRVLFVGVTRGREELSRLAARVDRALVPEGFEGEKRSSTPHLTLGRVKYIEDRERLDGWYRRNRPTQ